MIQRFYTKAGKNPFDTVDYRVYDADNGRGYIVPVTWHDTDVELFVQDVFYPHPIADVALTRGAADTDDFENDIRDVIARVVLGIATALFDAGFLKTETIDVFKDELSYVLLHQRLTLETSIWASAGLVEKYNLGQEKTISVMNDISALGHDVSLRGKKITSYVVQPDDPRPYLLDIVRLHTRAQKIKNKQTGDVSKPVSVLLPLEHVDSLDVIDAQKQSDMNTIAGDLGRDTLREISDRLMASCDRDSVRGFDPAWNKDLGRCVQDARDAGCSDAVIQSILQRAAMGDEYIDWGMTDDLADDEGFFTTLSAADDFFETAMTGHGFETVKDGRGHTHVQSSDVLTNLADAIWSSGQPNILFRDRVRENTVFENSDHLGISADGGLIAPAGASAPMATLNLKSFQSSHDIGVDIESFEQTIRLGIFALEGVILLSEKQTGQSDTRRAVLLGMTGYAEYLMGQGISYADQRGRGIAGLLTAILTGVALKTSAEMARDVATFETYSKIQKKYLADVKKKMAQLSPSMGRGFGVGQMSLQKDLSSVSDHPLCGYAQKLWADVYNTGKEHGFRHAHVTGFDGHALDPVPAIVTRQGNGKFIHPSVMKSFIALRYAPAQMDDIYAYVMGSGTLFDAPKMNHATLKERGVSDETIARVEMALQSVGDICDAFYDPKTNMNGVDVLHDLGFTSDDIDAVNLFVCGAGVMHGAPHVKPEHMPIFDTAQKTRNTDQLRFVSADAEIKMQAVVEFFLSGSTRHTVYVDYYADVDDIEKLILLAWECGVKMFQCRRIASSLLSLVIPHALGQWADQTLGHDSMEAVESDENMPMVTSSPKKRSKAS